MTTYKYQVTETSDKVVFVGTRDDAYAVAAAGTHRTVRPVDSSTPDFLVPAPIVTVELFMLESLIRGSETLLDAMIDCELYTHEELEWERTELASYKAQYEALKNGGN